METSYTFDSLTDIVSEYNDIQEMSKDLSLEVVDGENLVPVLQLLRFQQEPRSIDADVKLSNALLRGKTIIFKYKGKELVKINVINSIELYFNEDPALLDILFGIVRGILLKKLTLPLKNLSLDKDSSNQQNQKVEQ
jgi:hypothetical protein